MKRRIILLRMDDAASRKLSGLAPPLGNAKGGKTIQISLPTCNKQNELKAWCE